MDVNSGRPLCFVRDCLFITRQHNAENTLNALLFYYILSTPVELFSIPTTQASKIPPMAIRVLGEPAFAHELVRNSCSSLTQNAGDCLNKLIEIQVGSSHSLPHPGGAYNSCGTSVRRRLVWVPQSNILKTAHVARKTTRPPKAQFGSGFFKAEELP